jgi:hypothetical protein
MPRKSELKAVDCLSVITLLGKLVSFAKNQRDGFIVRHGYKETRVLL